MSTGSLLFFWYVCRTLGASRRTYLSFAEHQQNDWDWGVLYTWVLFSYMPTSQLMRLRLAGSILKGVGSVGLSLIFWVIGYAFAGGTVIYSSAAIRVN